MTHYLKRCYNSQKHSLNYAEGIPMRFDTTHEYYLNDACVHYCSDHDTLMVCSHGESTDRLMIEGITKDVINRLRLELNKSHLEDNTNVTNQEALA